MAGKGQRRGIQQSLIQGGVPMAITIHIFYTGKNKSAKAFAEEMTDTGIVDLIRKEEGNLGYAYFASLDDPETILLIDRWKDQQALDFHHASKMMVRITALRNKYDLKMRVERFVDDLAIPSSDKTFIRE